MSNFIFMFGIGLLCTAVSDKIPSDVLGVSCVVAALVDFWSFFFRIFGGNK